MSVVRASNAAILRVDGIASGSSGGSSVYFLAGGSLLGAHGVKSSIAGGGYDANIWTYFANEYHIGYDSANPATKWETNGRVTFYGTTAPGTAGSNQVLIGGGQINAAGNITTAGYYSISGYVQPRSIVSLVNIGASTYSDIYTLVTNDLVQVTIGNATDGYAASAIITKASSGAPVIVRNDNSSANLTISVSGDAIRVTNGVGSTRTIIYCVTRLYG